MDFILIMISLALGFGQGLRFRRRKVKREVSQFKEEIKALKEALKSEQRKNRLSMYDVNQKIKGDQAMLEERLVERYSKYDSEDDFRKTYFMIQHIIDKWGNEFLNKESQIRISDIKEVYIDFNKINKKMTHPICLKYKLKSSKIQSAPMSEVFSLIIQFFKEINIELYDISYGEFIDAMTNVSEIIYK